MTCSFCVQRTVSYLCKFANTLGFPCLCIIRIVSCLLLKVVFLTILMVLSLLEDANDQKTQH